MTDPPRHTAKRVRGTPDPLSLADPGTVPTRYWHRLDDGRVQCDVCPRACRLHEGQRGLCFVRGRLDDETTVTVPVSTVREATVREFVLTSYGRSSGFCVDPIEKKPLNHFLPGTPVLSFGTAGCNLAWKFCQNWDISKSREIDTLADAASPRALAEAAEAVGARSVAFTYNDPTIFLEYAVTSPRRVTSAAQDGRGLRRVHRARGRRELYAHGCRQHRPQGVHRRLLSPGSVCSSRLSSVLDTLRVPAATRPPVWLEITTLLIRAATTPTPRSSGSRVDRGEPRPDVPLHFTAFHPDYKMLDLPRTPAATLACARRSPSITVAVRLHRQRPRSRSARAASARWPPCCPCSSTTARSSCAAPTCHYLRIQQARLSDRRTAEAIVAADADAIGESDAWGTAPLRGLLRWAADTDRRIRLHDLRTSGDTVGEPTRVVGYGAFAMTERRIRRHRRPADGRRGQRRPGARRGCRRPAASGSGLTLGAASGTSWWRAWPMALLFLDQTAVIVALQSIGRDFGSSTGATQCTVTAYLLALAVFMPWAGRGADGGRPLWAQAGAARRHGDLRDRLARVCLGAHLADAYRVPVRPGHRWCGGAAPRAGGRNPGRAGKPSWPADRHDVDRRHHTSDPGTAHRGRDPGGRQLAAAVPGQPARSRLRDRPERQLARPQFPVRVVGSACSRRRCCWSG